MKTTSQMPKIKFRRNVNDSGKKTEKKQNKKPSTKTKIRSIRIRSGMNKVVKKRQLGDSMIRQIRGFEMAKSIGKSSHVVVKSFSGATTDNIKHYIIPTK